MHKKGKTHPLTFSGLWGVRYSRPHAVFGQQLKKKLRENHVHVLLRDFNQTPAYTLKIQTLKLKSDKEGLKNL